LPRSDHPRAQFVVGEGIASPLFVAVGEGPGRVEGQTGRPFVGPTGQLLMQAFAETGVTREQVYLTNATLCQPFPKATDKDKQAAATAKPPSMPPRMAMWWRSRWECVRGLRHLR
jgi:DNA polymerase